MIGIFMFLVEKAMLMGEITSAQMYSERSCLLDVKKENGEVVRFYVNVEGEKKDA